MDPHEMMELMMSNRNSLKPFPFEKLMQNTAMFKQHETVDGAAINIMFPLGNQFQIGGLWTLSNTKGAQFELMSSINNHNGSPMMPQDEVQSMVFRFASDNTGMVMGNFNLPWKWVCQTQWMFNDPNCQDVMSLIALQKDWHDNSLALRFQGMQGQGVYSATYMQSLTRFIQAGFQLNYAVSISKKSNASCLAPYR
jgi:hypothetical protein